LLINKWLENMKDKKKQWASRYTWSHKIYGMRSTQRSESFHATIDHVVSTKHSIYELFLSLNGIKENQNLKTQVDFERSTLLLGRGPDTSLSVLVQKLALRVNNYAMHIIKSQAHQAGKYSAIPFDNQTNKNKYDREYKVSFIRLKENSMEAGTDEKKVHDTNLHEHIDVGYYADDSIHMLQEYDHVATCRSCTCQFFLTFGLPCRHSIRVWLNLDKVDSIDLWLLPFIDAIWMQGVKVIEAVALKGKKRKKDFSLDDLIQLCKGINDQDCRNKVGFYLTKATSGKKIVSTAQTVLVKNPVSPIRKDKKARLQKVYGPATKAAASISRELKKIKCKAIKTQEDKSKTFNP
jgi:hypothetical protein